MCFFSVIYPTISWVGLVKVPSWNWTDWKSWIWLTIKSAALTEMPSIVSRIYVTCKYTYVSRLILSPKKSDGKKFKNCGIWWKKKIPKSFQFWEIFQAYHHTFPNELILKIENSIIEQLLLDKNLPRILALVDSSSQLFSPVLSQSDNRPSCRQKTDDTRPFSSSYTVD